MDKKTVTAWAAIDKYGYVVCSYTFRRQVLKHLQQIFGSDLAKKRRSKFIRIVKAKITWEDK